MKKETNTNGMKHTVVLLKQMIGSPEKSLSYVAIEKTRCTQITVLQIRQLRILLKYVEDNGFF